MGIAGGLIILGLLSGAISKSIWLLLGFSSAGFLIAAAFDFLQRKKEQVATSCKLTQYPPYGY